MYQPSQRLNAIITAKQTQGNREKNSKIGKWWKNRAKIEKIMQKPPKFRQKRDFLLPKLAYNLRKNGKRAIIASKNEQGNKKTMSQLDLLKLLQTLGEEVDIADFSPDELQEMLDRMQNDGELPLSKEAFKEKYFAFYDDVKDKSLKKQDW